MSLKHLQLWLRNENIYNWQGSIIILCLKHKRDLEHIQVRDLELYTQSLETIKHMEELGGIIVDRLIPGKYKTYF